MTAVPDKGTSQLEQTKVIGWPLVVAYQYRPALGPPAQGAFHHPPPSRVGFLARLVQFLFANTPDVRLVSGVSDGPVADGIVMPLVQTQVLGAFRPLHHYALQRRPEEFRIVDISSGHHYAQWPACRADQDAFLAPSLAPVRGIASNSAPPKRAFPMEQSADCHSQFTLSNSRHSSIRTAQMPSSTPRSTQRWKARWMVLSSPSSLGKWFHWQELRIRKMTPSSIFRWFTRLRPFTLGGSNSKITGSIRSHRSSGISHIVGRVSLFPIIHHHTSFPQLNRTAYLFSLSDQSYFEIVSNTTTAHPPKWNFQPVG